MENLYRKNNIRTFTGKYVNVFDPDPDTICIGDIAHALSNICRFGGHTKEFFSVAQHSIYVAQRLPPKFQLTGLLHDAAEAYLLDLPRPIKEKMSDYVLMEDRLMKVIAKKFGIIYPFPKIVKEVDTNALEYEWKNIVLANNLFCTNNVRTIFLKQYNLLQLATYFI